MIGFASAVTQDVPPFMLVDGNPLAVRGFNVVGLRRRDFSPARIAAVKQMHRLLYRQGKTLEEARARDRRAGRRSARGRGRRRADERLPRQRHARHRALSHPMSEAQRQFSLVAGEASGDLLAGLMLDGLQARWPGLKAAGIGGPQMLARGFESWWPQEKLAVRGYVEVLRHYAEIAGIRRQLKARLLRESPDIFIGVDAPDFNLDLEAGLRSRGIKTAHFVCPSIWAWRPERVEKLRAAADHVLCIFPFEPALLAEHGIAASYVGHPLAKVIPMDARPGRRACRARPGRPTRRSSRCCPAAGARRCGYLAARFFAAAALMLKARPALQFIAPVLPNLRAEVEQLLQASGMAGRVKLLDGRSHAALAACDVTLIASGTATLEAALFKRPMVISYHMNPLTWHLVMRRKQLQPWVGLPNILCGEFVVPEVLQDAATPAGAGRCHAGVARRARQGSRLATTFLRAACRIASAIRRHCAPMRSRKFLKAEQAALAWDAPGLDGRRRRGRPRPAGRAGRRRGRDPRRPAARSAAWPIRRR